MVLCRRTAVCYHDDESEQNNDDRSEFQGMIDWLSSKSKKKKSTFRLWLVTHPEANFLTAQLHNMVPFLVQRN